MAQGNSSCGLFPTLRHWFKHRRAHADKQSATTAHNLRLTDDNMNSVDKQWIQFSQGLCKIQLTNAGRDITALKIEDRVIRWMSTLEKWSCCCRDVIKDLSCTLRQASCTHKTFKAAMCFAGQQACKLALFYSRLVNPCLSQISTNTFAEWDCQTASILEECNQLRRVQEMCATVHEFKA